MFSKQLNQSNSVAFFVRNIEMSDVAPRKIVAAFRHVTALTGVSPRGRNPAQIQRYLVQPHLALADR